MKYKVVIPTAGLGSRLKGLSRHVNKALVTVGNKPVITHIIERFPVDVTIVIPLGYKGAMVRDYLTLAHPERQFEFREVYPYEGEGSGLGLTLLTVADLLDCPFIFCSNDTIVAEEIPTPDHNWMGYMEVGDSSEYRSLRLDTRGMVGEICSKGAQGDVKPYIGLAGIHDYRTFWETMRSAGEEAIAIGESFGMRALLDEGTAARRFTWFDTGNLDALARARATIKPTEDAVILDKENEAIWFVNGQVIKFSTDEDFIRNRVERAKALQPYVPEILRQTPNMYSYRFVKGKVMSRDPNPLAFGGLLDELREFWQPAALDDAAATRFRARCMTFYRDKTLARVKDYFRRFETFDRAEIVNGVPTPTMGALLQLLDWDWVADGHPVRFHGDLHFENILEVTEDGRPPFILLDWRQDFGGDLHVGDIYYDLGKLAHGLLVSHNLIDRNLFDVRQQGNRIDFDFLRKNSLTECLKVLEDWCARTGYDARKVTVMTALIFLNIAALHHYPYSKFLFYLGKHMLAEAIAIDTTIQATTTEVAAPRTMVSQ